jgi:hypothetical protein
LDSTITDEDLDVTSARFVQGFRDESRDPGPDLSVDGLAESFFMRIVRALSMRRS